MKKKVIIVLILVLSFFAIDVFVLDAVLDRNVDKAQLQQTITKSCDCEDINFDMSGKGLSLKNDVYGDFTMVVLTNCDTTNFDKTVKVLHETLQMSVDNFCELDLLQLTFENNSEELAIAEIRNCELTLKYN